MGMITKSKVYGIDVRFLEDQEAFDFWYDKMPSYRKSKIDAMKPLKGKLLSLGAGIILLKGLEEFGCEGAEIAFSDNKKTYIDGADSLYFNLSHSGSMAVCAFSDSEVGIDIEQNKAFKDSLIDYVFDDREKEYIRDLAQDESQMNALFTRLWTMKESIMKYFGKGITMGPKSIYVDDALHIYHEGRRLDELNLTTYSSKDFEDYQISVCSEHADFSKEVRMLKMS